MDCTIKLGALGEAEVRTENYLGDRFPLYREALAAAGARWIGDRKCNVIHSDGVPILLEALSSLGFSSRVDQAIVDRIQAQASEARALADAGMARLEAADLALAGTGRALFAFQRSGVRWLAPRKRALLCDEMGLGKTVQALMALPENAAVMVVCPGAAGVSWANEIFRWRKDLRPSLIKSGLQWRWPRAGEVMISTYGTLPDPKIGTTPPLAKTVLISDEAHLLKNSKTKRSKSWAAIRSSVEAADGSVWLLTGTPLLNRPPELWAVLGAASLAHEAFGSYPRFCALFNASSNQVWVKGADGKPTKRNVTEFGDCSSEVPLLLQRVSLHRRRIDVLPDLPTKRRVTREVTELDPDAIRACDDVVAALAERGLDLTKIGAIDDLGKLISGPVFELMSKARAQLASAKIPLVQSIVEEYEENEEPLVVVSAHREPVQIIGRREGWAAITGETSVEDRGQIAADFQAGKLRGVALTYKAGGVAITLTRAAHMLLVDLEWTPALISQAEDRICRIGQDRGVLITSLVADHPLDQRVCELVLAKQILIEDAIEASAVGAEEVRHDPAEQLARAAEAIATMAPKPSELPPPPESPPKKTWTVESLGVACVEPYGNFRPAQDESELRAARAILYLASMDSDRASEKNGAGFSKFDSDFGISLASNLRSHARLSDKQWAAAMRLATRYRAQVRF